MRRESFSKFLERPALPAISTHQLGDVPMAHAPTTAEAVQIVTTNRVLSSLSAAALATVKKFAKYTALPMAACQQAHPSPATAVSQVTSLIHSADSAVSFIRLHTDASLIITVLTIANCATYPTGLVPVSRCDACSDGFILTNDALQCCEFFEALFVPQPIPFSASDPILRGLSQV
jgi:hypothetical protein